jgi:rubrerythrin
MNDKNTSQSLEDVEAEAEARRSYRFLGDRGLEVKHIFQSVDPDDEMGHLDIWNEYLEENLPFPFEAVVDKWQDRGP